MDAEKKHMDVTQTPPQKIGSSFCAPLEILFLADFVLAICFTTGLGLLEV